jgi:hypothetical protein
LPALATDGSGTLEICDPAPGQAIPESVDVLIGCGDGTEMGMRAVQTATTASIERTYLDLPVCATLPCSSESVGTAIFTAWTADGPWTTRLDARTQTATAPEPAPDAGWPLISAATPAVKRPRFDGAPAEIAGRQAFPYCGRSELGEPRTPMICFVAAVVAGRPAEVVDVGHGTEGGTSIAIIRFSGRGPVVTYRQHLDDQGRTTTWFRQWNRLILGIEPWSWSPDPLDAGFRELR